MSDDYVNTQATTGSVAIGGQVTGNIELPSDEDWFKVSLQAGVTYVFDLRGADSGGGTLGSGSSEAYLTLYDTRGYLEESAINGGAGGDPLMSFVPTVSGTYYLGVEDLYDTGTGTYTLRASVPDSGAPVNVMTGTSQADQLAGTAGKDRISGLEGNDTLIAGAGDDYLDGGLGIDLAIYSTARIGATI